MKTARRGQPRVGNDGGGRLDTEEWAHGQGEHTGAGEGSDVDLGEGVGVKTGGSQVGGLELCV